MYTRPVFEFACAEQGRQYDTNKQTKPLNLFYSVILFKWILRNINGIPNPYCSISDIVFSMAFPNNEQEDTFQFLIETCADTVWFIGVLTYRAAEREFRTSSKPCP